MQNVTGESPRTSRAGPGSGGARRPDPDGDRAARERLARLARMLDGWVRIPGTRWTIGAEAVLGVLPVVGDFAGLLVSAWIVAEGARLGAPPALLARMSGNIGLDALAGSVPVAGDVFDVAFKANQRNVRLLQQHFGEEPAAPAPAGTAPVPRLLVAALAVAAGLAAWLAWRTWGGG